MPAALSECLSSHRAQSLAKASGLASVFSRRVRTERRPLSRAPPCGPESSPRFLSSRECGLSVFVVPWLHAAAGRCCCVETSPRAVAGTAAMAAAVDNTAIARPKRHVERDLPVVGGDVDDVRRRGRMSGGEVVALVHAVERHIDLVRAQERLRRRVRLPLAVSGAVVAE
jgi:hypothetical protein